MSTIWGHVTGTTRLYMSEIMTSVLLFSTTRDHTEPTEYHRQYVGNTLEYQPNCHLDCKMHIYLTRGWLYKKDNNRFPILTQWSWKIWHIFICKPVVEHSKFLSSVGSFNLFVYLSQHVSSYFAWLYSSTGPPVLSGLRWGLHNTKHTLVRNATSHAPYRIWSPNLLASQQMSSTSRCKARHSHKHKRGWGMLWVYRSHDFVEGIWTIVINELGNWVACLWAYGRQKLALAVSQLCISILNSAVEIGSYITLINNNSSPELWQHQPCCNCKFDCGPQRNPGVATEQIQAKFSSITSTNKKTLHGSFFCPTLILNISTSQGITNVYFKLQNLSSLVTSSSVVLAPNSYWDVHISGSQPVSTTQVPDQRQKNCI